MPFYYLSLAAGLIVTAVFLFSRSKGASVKNLFLKMASSLCFILTAVFAVMANYRLSSYGTLIIMGGVLGLCGDITLDLKFIYQKDSHEYLISGFLFFLVGHIFYNSALILNTRLKWWWVLICVVIAVVVGIVNTLSGKMLGLDYGKYKGIVFYYVIFLTLTALVSILAAIVIHSVAMIAFAVGAVLFLLSDVVLSFTYFGKGWDKPVHIFVNHLLYYAGQFLIASSVFLM